jgi:hypothetical protein
MVISPKLVWTRKWGGLATHDAYNRPRVYISRNERVDVIRFTVFHEAGHIAHRHPWTATGSSDNIELWAWKYAGRLIAATHSNILAALIDVRGRHSPNHGTAKQRVGAMWSGYRAAGGRELFSPEQKRKLRNLTPAQIEQLRAQLSPQDRESLRRLVARARRRAGSDRK